MLYKLGIPIPVEYSGVYTKLFEFFKTSKRVNLRNYHDDSNICELNKKGDIVYARQFERTESGNEYSIILRINSTFGEMIEYIDTIIFDKSELNIIIDVILTHKKVKYDYHWFASRFEKMNGYTYFEYLKLEYLKGNKFKGIPHKYLKYTLLNT